MPTQHEIALSDIALIDAATAKRAAVKAAHALLRATKEMDNLRKAYAEAESTVWEARASLHACELEFQKKTAAAAKSVLPRQ